jgi:hypothetical protein
MKHFFSAFDNHLHKNDRIQSYLLLIIVLSLALHLLCMGKGSLLVEEAYYWNYSQHLDWSYLDHPPMVALLIKVFTSLLGTNEFSVRSSSLFCWFITALFSYKLCELIEHQSGRYTVLLLATLPFFFFQSIVITPDVPLITCWSACLYYLYRSLILNNATAWYWTGLWLGLGMLSKYTIALIAFATLCYVLIDPKARFWLTRKEPYLASVIAVLFFTPVIYWNAHHEWVSFIFQTSRRFDSTTSVHTHILMMVVLFFITPLGIVGLWELAKKSAAHDSLAQAKKRFIQYYTFIPLSFFALFSLNHEVNFNWSGPLFLALLPWLSRTMIYQKSKRTLWFAVALALLVFYSSVLLIINYNQSELIQQKILIKIIAWGDLIKKIHAVAEGKEQQNHVPIVFVPLDKYPISSELAFYQTKLLQGGLISKKYPIIGAHIFNRESLMYRYWSPREDLSGVLLVLLSKEPWRFEDPWVTRRIAESTELAQVWSLGQGQNIKNIPYYYKVVRLKE